MENTMEHNGFTVQEKNSSGESSPERSQLLVSVETFGLQFLNSWTRDVTDEQLVSRVSCCPSDRWIIITGSTVHLVKSLEGVKQTLMSPLGRSQHCESWIG